MNKFISFFTLLICFSLFDFTARAENVSSTKKPVKSIRNPLKSISDPTENNQRDFAYFQLGGGRAILIEFSELNNAWVLDSRLGFKSSSGWGAELFFALVPHQYDAPMESARIAADAKLLGVAPTYSFQLSKEASLGLGLGVGYLIVNRTYFSPSSNDHVYRWSLAPDINFSYKLSNEVYAHLGFRAVFTVTGTKLTNEPRILLPTIGLGYRF
ncbi:MAG: hypothetical protein EBQ92_03700 [Proteobacteria bacterium]|nr:hypothetical protein [Pseudomonadota bacterium]